MNANPTTLLLHPRGLPPGWTRAEAREAVLAARDAALAVLPRVPDEAITRDHVHGAARWVAGLGVPLFAAEEDRNALLEAWAGRIARSGLRLGRAALRQQGRR